MRKQNSIYLLALAFVFALSGCVVRTYQVAKDRLDQDLGSGNRGYLKGQAPYSEAKERKTKRSNQVVEIELHSPIKFEKAPKQKLEGGTAEQSGEDKDIWGNQGYLTKEASEAGTLVETKAAPVVNMQAYIVGKGDTLQKISQKFYGTTKKWVKIYEANKDALKGPNKIYPGQSINIPTDNTLQEPKENLK